MPRQPSKRDARATLLPAHGVGCGIDIVDIARFERAAGEWGGPFLRRVFTPLELSHAAKRRDRLAHLAAHFAAKEAVVKAIAQLDPSHPLVVSQIEVRNDAMGRPSARLLRSACRAAIHISLSHERHVAVACALALADSDARFSGRATRTVARARTSKRPH